MEKIEQVLDSIIYDNSFSGSVELDCFQDVINELYHDFMDYEIAKCTDKEVVIERLGEIFF